MAIVLAALAPALPQVTSAPAEDESVRPGMSYDFVSILSERRFHWGLLVAFAAGVLVSFTPCVYPMIPITIGIIAGRDEKPSVGRSFALSCVYVLGLAIVYAALGVVAGTVGAAFRNVLMSPYVLGAVAAFFVALALSMFGLYEIQVPPALATRLQAVGGAGVLGILLMGMVSGIIASPCTAAPLAGILTFVAATGDVLKGFSLLFVFAWGMGLLLIVVGTSAGTLKSLPKSGQWMVHFRHLFGFVFLGVALYFIRTLIPDLAYFIGLSACTIAGGIALGALDSLPTDPGAGLKTKKGAALAITVLGFYMLLGTLWSRGLLLPPRPPAQAIVVGDREPVVEAGIQWQTDIEGAFKTARDGGKPVLIDFRADWCDLCEEMEKEAFPRPDVIDAASRFVPLRVDVTNLEEEEKALVGKYDLVGYPTLVVATGDGELVDSVYGYEGPEHVRDFLQSAAPIRKD
jgi:thiol:disulfide interchange protein DsbD